MFILSSFTIPKSLYAMKNAYLILLFPCLFLLACNGHHHGTAEPVQLDNGKRWQANPETTSGIAEMQAILGRYEGQAADAAKRYALRQELEAAFQNIFKQCTMKGEAHNQLHNYLVPMNPLFEKIDGADTGESEAAMRQLKEHLAKYASYFE